MNIEISIFPPRISINPPWSSINPPSGEKTILVLRHAIKLQEFSFLEDIYNFKLTSFYLGAMKDDDYIFYIKKGGKLQIKMELEDNLILFCGVIRKQKFKKDIIINLREESEKISNGKIKPDDFKGYIQKRKFWDSRMESISKKPISTDSLENISTDVDYFVNFDENKANDTAFYIELLKCI